MILISSMATKNIGEYLMNEGCTLIFKVSVTHSYQWVNAEIQFQDHISQDIIKMYCNRLFAVVQTVSSTLTSGSSLYFVN